MEISTAVGWTLISLVLHFGGTSGLVITTSFAAYKNWDDLREFWIAYVNVYLLIHTSQIFLAAFVFVQLLRYGLNLSRHSSPRADDEFPVGPLFFPCRTDHARLTPTKHKFSYSYLFVGVPVPWNGNSGGMIACDDGIVEPWYLRLLTALSFGFGRNGAWWSVNGDDYLGRGHEEDGLQGKLRTYLKTLGIDSTQYAHAYLLTAARFLNYASNPVSIWHLYSQDRKLKALVLEVNNTFDERHNYFLRPDTTIPEPTKAVRYTGTWPKDFYVSVFNSRQGKYSLTAIDPLATLLNPPPVPAVTKNAPIDSTITLSNADGSRAMLVARVYSTSPPLDPSKMSIFSKISFILSWWWVGLATFPRTVVQAVTILQKKMPWIFTPQPRKDTMPKHASETEILIEQVFRSYLRSVVQSSPHPLLVRYVPAGIIGGNAEMMSSGASEIGVQFAVKEHEIRILSPLFYSRLVQYSSTHAALLSEYKDSATIFLSSPSFLSKLDFSPLSAEALNSLYDNALFTLLASMKKTPAIIEPLADEAIKREIIGPEPAPFNASEIQDLKGLSGLDVFVFATGSKADRREYASRLLKMLFAEQFGLGWMEILDMEIFAIEAVVAWGAVKLIS